MPTSLPSLLLNVLSDGRAVKSNKLRKSVFGLPGVDPKTTWDDFRDALEALIRDGKVSKTTINATSTEVAHEVVHLPTATIQTTLLVEKRTYEDEGSGDSSPTKKMKHDIGVGDSPEAEAMVKNTMEVPAKFLPMLLRQHGQKIKNIELNSKTSIDVDAGDGGKAATLEAWSTSTITITGSEEKHVRTARLFLDKMLSAFASTSKAEVAAATNDGAGGKGKGNGGKGGLGKGNKGGKGKKGNSSPFHDGHKGGRGKGKGRSSSQDTLTGENPFSSEKARAKKRDRKFY